MDDATLLAAIGELNANLGRIAAALDSHAPKVTIVPKGTVVPTRGIVSDEFLEQIDGYNRARKDGAA